MKSGFFGGVVVDYPNSTKAKKFFLVLMTGGNMPLPKALGTEGDSNSVAYSKKRYVVSHVFNLLPVTSFYKVSQKL